MWNIIWSHLGKTMRNRGSLWLRYHPRTNRRRVGGRKLSASDKIKFNQWVQFHDTYQRTHGITGTSQIIRYVSNLNKPAIPTEIAKEELMNIDIDEEQVQIIRTVDKSRKMIKKVKPILIKKEIDREYASKVPFEKHTGEISFEDDK